MSRRGLKLRGVAVPLLLLVAGACASPPPPPPSDPLFDENGVRQRPLTTDEAEKILHSQGTRIAACYRNERLNLDAKTGNFVFRVWIPTDGSGADVEVVKETVPDLKHLRGCIEDVLARTVFPKHNGEPLTLIVPIEES